jgi:hypothetical protein
MRLLPGALRLIGLRSAAFFLAAFLFLVQPTHAEYRPLLTVRRPFLDGEYDGERRKSSLMKPTALDFASIEGDCGAS